MIISLPVMRSLVLILVALTLGFTSKAMATVIVTATLTQTATGTPNSYNLILNNSSTAGETVNTFWFCWVPGQDYMAVSPTNVVAPTGWSAQITHGGSTDGFAIRFSANTPLAAGISLTGFTFQSTSSLVDLQSSSVFYPGIFVTTSEVFTSGGTLSFTIPVGYAAVSKAMVQTQTSNSTPAGSPGDVGTPGPFSFNLAAPLAGKVKGPSASYTLALSTSGGGDDGQYEYTSGSLASLSTLNSNYPDGNYTLPDGQVVSLTGDVYPNVAKLTKVNGGTPVWNSMGQLELDPTVANTLTWSAFTTTNANYTFATGGHEGVELKLNPTGSGNQTTLLDQEAGVNATSTVTFNTLTIPANTMVIGSTYDFQIFDSLASTVHGTDVADYELVNSFTIAPTPLIVYAAEKEHVRLQTSNSAPVNYAGPSYDPGPYNFHSFGGAGSTKGPTGTVYPLAFNMDDNAYEYFSVGFSSLANLNATYPDGTYTLSNGTKVSLTGDFFPNVVQITQVNGAVPYWNTEGQLVLNPAIANTLTWTPFTANNGTFDYATGGFEHIEIYSNGEDNVDLNPQAAGPLGEAAFHSYTVPANTLTNGHTYTGGFLYSLLAGGTTGGSASYLTDTYLNILASIALSPQTVSFPTIPDMAFSSTPIALQATASSGLPIVYTSSGPVKISGNTATLTGLGKVFIRASQPGNSSYAAATSVLNSFTISIGSQTITFPPIASQSFPSSFSTGASASSGLPLTYTTTGPVKVSGNTLTLTGTGTVNIRAHQDGNADYAAAPTVLRTFTVTKGP